MTWKDLRDRVASLFIHRDTDGSERPDGGTSCYRPIRKKKRDEMMQPLPEEQTEDGAQIPYAHTGFTGMNPPSEYGFAGRQASMPPQPRQEMGNISYMPGVQVPGQAEMPVHVEHLMAMTSLRSCYEAIECMKNGETLIISLDAIANESEAMRCQDMLAGAAFTLGCGVRMVPGARIVLIAPEGVKILPEETPSVSFGASFGQGYGAAPGVPSIQPMQPMQEEVPVQEVPPRRERRSSQRAAQWNAAANSGSYNPYTGNMPAAAGDYSRFGGYGF